MQIRMITRPVLGYLVSPILAMTGRRFSKLWRNGRGFKAFVYRHVDVVAANWTAEKLAKPLGLPTPMYDDIEVCKAALGVEQKL